MSEDSVSLNPILDRMAQADQHRMRLMAGAAWQVQQTTGLSDVEVAYAAGVEDVHRWLAHDTPPPPALARIVETYRELLRAERGEPIEDPMRFRNSG